MSLRLLGLFLFISFGASYPYVNAGEARPPYKFLRYDEDYSSNPNADNAYLLQRYLFHADYHPTECLRVFGELQSSLEGGRPGGPRPPDRDAIDIHQLFADLV